MFRRSIISAKCSDMSIQSFFVFFCLPSERRSIWLRSCANYEQKGCWECKLNRRSVYSGIFSNGMSCNLSLDSRIIVEPCREFVLRFRSGSSDGRMNAITCACGACFVCHMRMCRHDWNAHKIQSISCDLLDAKNASKCFKIIITAYPDQSNASQHWVDCSHNIL